MASFARKKSNFRKRLGIYSFKVVRNNVNKNPHALPLHQREAFKKQGAAGIARMKEYRDNSGKPWGRLTNKGRFVFDVDKVPFYNIPDLSGFTLKPYVSYNTPLVAED